MSASKRITKRLQEARARYFANDNISKYVNETDLEQLQYELTEKFEEVLRTLIIDIDNDPNSKGTAKRLAKMYLYELFEGRYQPPPEATAFPNDGEHGQRAYTGMLIVRAEIKSICSHHHQPTRGVAYIGIIPTKKVIGLSKYIRLAQHCARRGTLQEELTNDIADTIMKETGSENVAVHIGITHGCCENRGVGVSNSLTQTTVLHGMFYMSSVKEEFFQSIQLQGGYK